MAKLELEKLMDKEVILKFSGRVNSMNVEEISRKLTQLRNDYHQGHLSLDCADLEYISSAGLRVLLKLQKEEKEKISILETSLDLYEIFEITGFNNILDVHKKMREISVEGCEKIGQGANGAVYRIDCDTIIKVFQPNENISTVQRERDRAQQAFLKGIPTAISYDVVKCGDSFGIVFELLNAECLSTAIKNHPEKFDEYAKEYVRVLKNIHQTTVDDDNIKSIKEVYYAAIEECGEWFTKEELNQLKTVIESIPESRTLIHGDYHAHNIMLQNEELILIDMGDLSYGHPVFEFLATAATQVNLVKLNPEFAEIHTGMPVEYITKLWKNLLNLYFVDKTEEEIDKIEKQINQFSKLKVALAPVFGRGAGKEVIEASVADAKANLLPFIGEMIGSIDW